ncbi:MAG: DUF2490 domain-containing protein, partial [Bacteroidota bacterium]
IRSLLIIVLLTLPFTSFSQSVDEDQLGAWYMYFFNKRFEKSQFGLQGDYQFRYWNFGSDLEQILLRTGLTYSPKDVDILFTFGYGNITSGVPGESSSTSNESRIYQEALFPQKIGSRFLLNHRLRFEQRWVEGQDFRTRYRYNLFVNVPLNNTSIDHHTVYLAFYNEIFINGQRGIGDGRNIEYFDRNRTYLGLGFGILKNMRIQTGWMRQTTANWAKGQTQFSLHHSF